MIREVPEWGRGKWWEELWKWDDKNTGRGCKRGERKCFALTFFCVARCILARVAHQAIEVPGSSFQHVIPGQQKKYKHLFLFHVSSSALLKVLKVVLKLLERIWHELNQFFFLNVHSMQKQLEVQPWAKLREDISIINALVIVNQAWCIFSPRVLKRLVRGKTRDRRRTQAANVVPLHHLSVTWRRRLLMRAASSKTDGMRWLWYVWSKVVPQEWLSPGAKWFSHPRVWRGSHQFEWTAHHPPVRL